MSGAIDPSARGSDVARDSRQYYARRLGDLVIGLLGLNRAGFVATEIVQKIAPVCQVSTRKGPLLSRGGHGRLRWRAETFYTEEPETISWLDALTPDDMLWDIGANVGLYSLYAAKVAGCRVLAAEPEAQNFALLMENIAMNGLAERIVATNLAITNATNLGRLAVHAITKGGAYNQFAATDVPPAAITQLTMGASIDDLVERFGCPMPTHIKIDVDGNEPDIIAGASKVLADPRCRGLLIEIRTDLPDHMAIVDRLAEFGFKVTSRRSNWDSRENRDRENEYPADNMIFARG
jgi:FkbM family methyltransferase